ncbi:hypothetical protein HDU76_009889, partial [Blyttiomyces sp. JEL0837]
MNPITNNNISSSKESNAKLLDGSKDATGAGASSDSFLISITPELTTTSSDLGKGNKPTPSTGLTARMGPGNSKAATQAASFLGPRSIARNMEENELTVNSMQLEALRDMAVASKGAVIEEEKSETPDSPFHDSYATNAVIAPSDVFFRASMEPESMEGGSAPAAIGSDRQKSKIGLRNRIAHRSDSQRSLSDQPLPHGSIFDLFPNTVKDAPPHHHPAHDHQPSVHSQQQHAKLGKTQPSKHCALCDRPLPQPIGTQTVEIRNLKLRFQRELKKAYPLRAFLPTDRICVKDLHYLMQKRIDQLLEEDQTDLARLQDDAMRNLGEYELQEQNWQKQFERGWTFGEKAADLVARFGGSWKFIGCLLGFLGTWAALNLILGSISNNNPNVNPWDPYPFILLNLFLSMLAALQAPIIMMSQNRQSQLDKLQSDYISKIVLRAEHQVRH